MLSAISSSVAMKPLSAAYARRAFAISAIKSRMLLAAAVLFVVMSMTIQNSMTCVNTYRQIFLRIFVRTRVHMSALLSVVLPACSGSAGGELLSTICP